MDASLSHREGMERTDPSIGEVVDGEHATAVLCSVILYGLCEILFPGVVTHQDEPENFYIGDIPPTRHSVKRRYILFWHRLNIESKL